MIYEYICKIIINNNDKMKCGELDKIDFVEI